MTGADGGVDPGARPGRDDRSGAHEGCRPGGGRDGSGRTPRPPGLQAGGRRPRRRRPMTHGSTTTSSATSPLTKHDQRSFVADDTFLTVPTLDANSGVDGAVVIGAPVTLASPRPATNTRSGIEFSSPDAIH
jgi:hypothetical protein